MREYMKLMSKRVFLRKSNIGLVFSVLAIVLFVLIMNMRTQRLYGSLTSQVEFQKLNIESDTKMLQNMDKDSEYYVLKQRTIDNTVLRLERYEKLVSLYEERDYPSFYKLYEEDLDESIESALTTEMAGVESNPYFHKQLAYINYLDEHQLVYEDIEFPIFGLSFMVFMSDYILPTLILICIIYILAQAFTLDYAKGIEISNLFPIGRKKVFFTKMCVGIGTSVFVFLLLALSSFAFASLINQNMGLSNPFITMAADGSYVGISLMSNLLKWMSLGVLFFVSVACFMYLLSTWIKEDTALFLTGMTIVLGVAYMPKFIPSLNPIAHLLPTTYMNYISVVQGDIAMQYGNVDITFHQGICILFLFIGISMFATYLFRVKMLSLKK